MSAAKVDSDGTVTQLDGRAPARVTIAAKDVQDPQTLAQILQDHEDRLADLERAWRPRRLYFRDVTVDATNTKKFYFHHGFGGRVNFFFGDAATGYADLRRHSDTDADTLVVTSANVCTLTLLVEEAG